MKASRRVVNLQHNSTKRGGFVEGICHTAEEHVK